jgi:hypothetical protein
MKGANAVGGDSSSGVWTKMFFFPWINYVICVVWLKKSAGRWDFYYFANLSIKKSKQCQ